MNAEAYQSTLRLIQAAQTGDQAALEQLVMENAALVKFVAKRYLNRGREFDDLYQLGCLGLLKAIRNFNVDLGVQFSTYAVPLILGEIRRYLRDDGLVRVSRSIKENAIKINRAAEKMFSETGQEPDVQALASATHLEPDEVLMALEASRPSERIRTQTVGTTLFFTSHAKRNCQGYGGVTGANLAHGKPNHKKASGTGELKEQGDVSHGTSPWDIPFLDSLK